MSYLLNRYPLLLVMPFHDVLCINPYRYLPSGITVEDKGLGDPNPAGFALIQFANARNVPVLVTEAPPYFPSLADWLGTHQLISPQNRFLTELDLLKNPNLLMIEQRVEVKPKKRTSHGGYPGSGYCNPNFPGKSALSSPAQPPPSDPVEVALILARHRITGILAQPKSLCSV